VRLGEVVNPQCPCPPGTTIDASNVLTGPFSAVITFDDMRTPIFGVTLEGMVSLAAQPITVTEPVGHGFLTRGPFDLFATFSAFRNDETLFSNRTFTGSGTFGLMLNEDFSTFHIGYDLPEAPAVPEPSTLLMLGSGVSALLMRRRRRLRFPVPVLRV
jgi:hypothetical protein